MNAFLESRFVENVHRLALGFEPIDSGRRTRIAHPIEIMFDEAQLGLPRPPIERHDSCLHALRYQPTLADRVNLRFFDHARRFVPRRLSIPIMTITEAESQPYTHRVRRPMLFPGAAYDVGDTATGLRGRVLRNSQPMRWARVEARIPGSNLLVGRAHGDDRGEFLLLLGSGAIPVGELVNPLPINLHFFGPAVPPIPASPDLPELDPLWDLPLEQVPNPGVADPVSAGETLPTNYTASSTSSVHFFLGALRSGVADFLI